MAATTSPAAATKAPAPDNKKPHITTQPITWGNWWQHVNWLNVTLIILIPMCGLIGSYWVPLRLKTAIFAVVYYFHTGLGITAGTITPYSNIFASSSPPTFQNGWKSSRQVFLSESLSNTL